MVNVTQIHIRGAAP